MNDTTTAKLDPATWFFGKEPYNRANPAPDVSLRPATPSSLYLRCFILTCASSGDRGSRVS